MKNKIAVLILFLLCSVLYGKEFTDQFTQEFGGMGSLAVRNDSYDNDTNKYIRTGGNLNPFYHFYVSKYIYVGPAINYSYEELEIKNVYNTKTNNINLGIDAGIAIGNKSNLIPYLQFNYSATLYSYTGASNNTTTGEKAKNGENGSQFAIDLGLKILISKHISINLSTGYTYSDTKGSSDYFRNNIQTSHEILGTKSNNYRIFNVGLSGLLF
jgi:hypothetical protein